MCHYVGNIDNFSEEPRPGPSSSGTTNPFQVSRHLPPNLNFSDSDSDEDDYDRESLLKNIDLDLKRIISRYDMRNDEIYKIILSMLQS